MANRYYWWALILMWGLARGAIAQTASQGPTNEATGEVRCCFDTIAFICVDSCDDLPNCYCGPSWCDFCPTRTLVAEGILGEGSGGCACPEYDFSLDNTCDPRRIGLENRSGLDLDSLIGHRVRIVGRQGGCFCRLCGPQQERLMPVQDFVCIAVETVQEIDRCAP